MVIKSAEEQVHLSFRGTWLGLEHAPDHWPTGDQMMRVDVLGEKLLTPRGIVGRGRIRMKRPRQFVRRYKQDLNMCECFGGHLKYK